MTRTVLTLLIVMHFTGVSIAQRTHNCSYGINGGWKIKSPDGRSLDVEEIISKQKDDTGIPEIVRRSLEAVSKRMNLRLMVYVGQNNAEAWMYPSGERLLLVDVGFCSRVNEMCDTRWAAISIIAHELGHHISNFRGDAHQRELSADYWSGYILQKLGASERSATAAMSIIGSDYDSETHPNKRRRIAQIRKGYADALSDG